MTPINLNYNHPKYTDKQLNKSLSQILNSNVLLSLATIKSDGKQSKSWINTAYFCFGPTLNFYILTPPQTQHSKNLEKNSSVAISIFDSRQTSSGKRGLQIFGNCAIASNKNIIEGYALYSARFPGLKQVIKSPADFDKDIIKSKLYKITPLQIKIFDEITFGEETWITLKMK